MLPDRSVMAPKAIAPDEPRNIDLQPVITHQNERWTLSYSLPGKDSGEAAEAWKSATVLGQAERAYR